MADPDWSRQLETIDEFATPRCQNCPRREARYFVRDYFSWIVNERLCEECFQEDYHRAEAVYRVYPDLSLPGAQYWLTSTEDWSGSTASICISARGLDEWLAANPELRREWYIGDERLYLPPPDQKIDREEDRDDLYCPDPYNLIERSYKVRYTRAHPLVKPTNICGFMAEFLCRNAPGDFQIFIELCSNGSFDEGSALRRACDLLDLVFGAVDSEPLQIAQIPFPMILRNLIESWWATSYTSLKKETSPAPIPSDPFRQYCHVCLEGPFTEIILLDPSKARKVWDWGMWLPAHIWETHQDSLEQEWTAYILDAEVLEAFEEAEQGANPTDMANYSDAFNTDSEGYGSEPDAIPEM
ncbi:hypothetical protein ABW19_dt0202438 [Dactylella cylindrospora]|nr:hypothetical protein ABW19_dt0202438 [Dactylella cylindrospora]